MRIWLLLPTMHFISTHLIFELLKLWDHGTVAAGDVLVLVTPLLDNGIEVDVAICSYSRGQRLGALLL